MSSNLRCNYCLLRDMERLAAQTNRIVTVRAHPVELFPNGVDVFIHPADYTPPESSRDLDEPADWFAAWLAMVGERCAC